MSDLKAGKYIIVLAGNSAPPPSPVGADLQGGPVAPVIVGGRDHVWLVRKNDNETYTLILQAGGGSLVSQPDGDNVIVGFMPGPGQWVIRKQDNDTYSIEVPSRIWPTAAWTLNSTAPGTKIALRLSPSPPTKDQLWRFIPLLDE